MSWILVRDNQGNEMVLNMKKEKKVKWRKHHTLFISEIKEEDLPGYFRLDDRKSLTKVTEDILQEELLNLNWSTELDGNKTNADIQQSSIAQKLKMEEIAALKENASNSQQIIDGLIKNNENFEKRTDFSKDKYIKKKKLKYDMLWKIEKCTLQNVFRHFMRQGPKDMM